MFDIDENEELDLAISSLSLIPKSESKSTVTPMNHSS